MTTTDTVDYMGKRYTAQVTKQDKRDYSVPCASYGTKRCMITQPHSSYVHLVMGLAEVAGTVEAIA